MERLIEVLADQVRVLSERTRENLVDIRGVGNPSVFQNDESKFYEWAKKIEDYLIGLESHLDMMLGWALDKETEIKQSMIAEKLDPTKKKKHDEVCEGGMRLKTVSGTSHRKRKLISRSELRTKRPGSEEKSTQNALIHCLVAGNLLRAITAPTASQDGGSWFGPADMGINGCSVQQEERQDRRNWNMLTTSTAVQLSRWFRRTWNVTCSGKARGDFGNTMNCDSTSTHISSRALARS